MALQNETGGAARRQFGASMAEQAIRWGPVGSWKVFYHYPACRMCILPGLLAALMHSLMMVLGTSALCKCSNNFQKKL
jgi:hypothetical protein